MCALPNNRPICCFVLNLFLLVSLNATAQLKAGFSTDKVGGCSPVVVQFTNQTTGASASATYHWDFGNGNEGVVPNPNAVYTNIGTYTVTLTVQDGTQTSSASQTVTVYAPPAVSFSPSLPKVCIPAAVVFTAGAAGGSAPGSSYLWDFADGTTQSGGAIISQLSVDLVMWSRGNGRRRLI